MSFIHVLRVLFHNKTDVWEEIEAKVNAENEVPILKTSNKVVTSLALFDMQDCDFKTLTFSTEKFKI